MYELAIVYFVWEVTKCMNWLYYNLCGRSFTKCMNWL